MMKSLQKALYLLLSLSLMICMVIWVSLKETNPQTSNLQGFNNSEREREREMALETVVYPQSPFGYSCNNDFNSMGEGGAWSFGLQQEDEALLEVQQAGLYENWDHYSSPEASTHGVDHHHSILGVFPTIEIPSASAMMTESTTTAPPGRRKRRRTKTCKNMEEVENQRMTHIAVERNRRKQMNEYLAALRSLMPSSYSQRGDQASIIGGAINFVKELEQHLQTLEGQRKIKHEPNENCYRSSPFAAFFSFPQYSTHASLCNNSPGTANKPIAENDRWPAAAIADIEVTAVDSHANLKILSKRRPKQLLKMVAGFQCLRLTVLHLNVTTVDELVLYSVSVKVEEGCELTTVDEIAAAVNKMLHKIEEESFVLS